MKTIGQNLSLAFLLIVFLSCGSNKDLSRNLNTNVFNNIVVAGKNENFEEKVIFERKIVKSLRFKGQTCIEGSNIFYHEMTEKEKRVKNLVRTIKRNDIDAVLTVNLISKKDSVKYYKGTKEKVFDRYERVGNEILRKYKIVNNPDRIEEFDNYILEAVFYNLKKSLKDESKPKVWVKRITITNPKSIEDAADKYTRKLVDALYEENVISR